MNLNKPRLGMRPNLKTAANGIQSQPSHLEIQSQPPLPQGVPLPSRGACISPSATFSVDMIYRPDLSTLPKNSERPGGHEAEKSLAVDLGRP